MKISARKLFILIQAFTVVLLVCFPVIDGPQDHVFLGNADLLPTAMAANIIALPNRSMTWDQAFTFCSGEGGVLPETSDVTAKWADGSYWLGELTDSKHAGIVIVNKTTVTSGSAAKSDRHLVICVQR